MQTSQLIKHKTVSSESQCPSMIGRTLACTVPRRELARRAVATMGDAAGLVAASTISGITFTAAAAYAQRRVRDMTLTTC